MEQPRRRNRKPLQVNSPFNAKKKKGWKIAAIAGGAVLVCGLAVAAVLLGWIPIPGVTPLVPQKETQPVEAAPDTVIHFVAGGDMNVTDSSVAAGKTENGYDFSKVFLDVMPVLSGSDVTALNFEGNLCGEPYGGQYASAPPQMLQALKNAGVDILQTANSKTITGGLLGMQSTLNAVRGAGMIPLGSYESEAEFEESGGYVIREVQGIRIALVAFTKGMDGRGLPEGSENCVNLLYEDYSSTYQKVNETRITHILRAAAKEKPDVTIALLHWGSEFNDQISKSQEKITALMQEEGVDAIIGTHSHYVQKMTFQQETGKFVAYSLGDFFGDGEKSGTNYSVLLDLEITKDGQTGKTKITDFTYTPIFIAREETGTRLLRIREAMTAFENNSLGRVSQESYNSMKAALTRIEKRIRAE